MSARCVGWKWHTEGGNPMKKDLHGVIKNSKICYDSYSIPIFSSNLGHLSKTPGSISW